MSDACGPCPWWGKMMLVGLFVGRNLYWLRIKPVFFSPVNVSREAVCFTLLDALVMTLWVDDLVFCGLSPFLFAMLVVALDTLYVPVSVHAVLANSQSTPGIALAGGASFLGLTAASGFGSAFLREEWWLLLLGVSWARIKRQLSSLEAFARVCGAVACLSRLVLFFASSWPGKLLVLVQAVVWLVRSHHWFIRSLSDAERLHLARSCLRLCETRTRLREQQALRRHCPLPSDLSSLAQSYL